MIVQPLLPHLEAVVPALQCHSSRLGLPPPHPGQSLLLEGDGLQPTVQQRLGAAASACTAHQQQQQRQQQKQPAAQAGTAELHGIWLQRAAVTCHILQLGRNECVRNKAWQWGRAQDTLQEH
jgi:hypothetical protein